MASVSTDKAKRLCSAEVEPAGPSFSDKAPFSTPNNYGLEVRYAGQPCVGDPPAA